MQLTFLFRAAKPADESSKARGSLIAQGLSPLRLPQQNGNHRLCYMSQNQIVQIHFRPITHLKDEQLQVPESLWRLFIVGLQEWCEALSELAD